MSNLDFFAAWLRAALARAHGEDAERGDVPGWVMVTVMSAILVVAILAVFEPQIKDAVTGAINSVSNSK
ncbi:hypothetical protein M6B22_07425 [Jatrophihabitans cynanchi]|jgi:predicted Co/Zn/Cd cation transporter (cation efflux family)|uniref:Uncharacterized protein n=1 Tax=Jatrophihabitans cynanchi TaxID=2944128 RepID=A0ABY7K156_9ACTN|nr:hypothetical protein [Jatrophihabitans sp. SB3-54]WAX58586.1 hypothetical protein M6B22_07425 [Jatrophihabitans sp. SB3-54]